MLQHGMSKLLQLISGGKACTRLKDKVIAVLYFAQLLDERLDCILSFFFSCKRKLITGEGLFASVCVCVRACVHSCVRVLLYYLKTDK